MPWANKPTGTRWGGEVSSPVSRTAGMHRAGNSVGRLAANGIRPVLNGASGASLEPRERATTSVTPADRSWESRTRFIPHTVAMPDSQPGQPKALSSALSSEKRKLLQSRHTVSPSDVTLTDVECAVCCMAMMPANEAVVRLPCGGEHAYHWRCLQPWFDKASFCPTCRGAIKLDKGRKAASPARTSPCPHEAAPEGGS